MGQCALRFLFFVFLSFFLPAHFTQNHDWSSGGAATRPTHGLKEREREIDEFFMIPICIIQAYVPSLHFFPYILT